MSNESSTPALPVLSELYPLSNMWWSKVERITLFDAVLASMGIDPETFAESCSLDRETSEDSAASEIGAVYIPSLGAEHGTFKSKYYELLGAINACEVASEDQVKAVGNFTYTITKIRKHDFVAWVLDPLVAWDLPAFIKNNPGNHPDQSAPTLESLPLKARREAIARWALKELVIEGIFKEFRNISKATSQIHKKMSSRSDFGSIACSAQTLRNFLFLKPDSIWRKELDYKKDIERMKRIADASKNKIFRRAPDTESHPD